MKRLNGQKTNYLKCSKEIKSLKITFVLLFFIFTQSVFGQEKINETYQIVSNPNNENTESYVMALNSANFECYRFESKSRILTFNTGVVIELFSFKKVTEAGYLQSNSCFIQDTVVAVDYELNLVGDKVGIKVPYDKNIKRVQNEK